MGVRIRPTRAYRRPIRYISYPSRAFVTVASLIILALVFRAPIPPLSRPTTFSTRYSTPSHVVHGGRIRGQPVYSRPSYSSWPPEPHLYREDGLLQVSLDAEKHPILQLVEDARKKWEDRLRRQSKTLDEAVKEYKSRHGRNPPRGFDAWWRYIIKHNVQLPDEYDQIFRDIQPFFGISPSDVRWLQHRSSTQTDAFILSSRNGTVDVASVSCSPEDKEWTERRAHERLKLLKLVEEFLPDLNMTFTAHGAPYQFISHQLKDSALQAAKDGAFIDLNIPLDDDALGWASACPPTTPLFHRTITHTHPRLIPNTISSSTPPPPKSFIHSHLTSMNPCVHPSLTQRAGIFLEQDSPSPHTYMSPMFGTSSTLLHSDILTPTLEGFNLGEEHVDEVSWDEKSDERMLWRGRSTGIVVRQDEEQAYWKQSQRQRLVRMFQVIGNGTGIAARFRPRMTTVLSPTEEEGEVVMNVEGMNEDLFDVTFEGVPVQCEKKACAAMKSEYRFEEIMSDEDSRAYKYVLDVDGNGWSSRFKRLMSSNALVLKSTIHPEWFSERIQPWLHYVPVKVDFSDMYDIMTFFRGIPLESHQTTTIASSPTLLRKGAHTDFAREIAKAGTQWSNMFWRKEDMGAYTLRLMLEYARVMSDERDSMDFVYDESIHGAKNFPHF